MGRATSHCVVCLYAALALVTASRKKSENSACTTSDGQPGRCISILSCEENLKYRLLDKKPKLCSWNRDVPVVCCPLEEEPQLFTGRGPSQSRRQNENANNVNCGTKVKTPTLLYVIGGTETTQRNWPWMVSIQKNPLGRFVHICGGTIISERLILTAAHCFPDSQDPQEYQIQTGADRLENNTNYYVERIVVHPKYKAGSHYHDIALVKVKAVISFTDLIRPICLGFGESNSDPSTGDEVEIAGWGQRSFGGLDSQILQEATLNIVAVDECNKTYTKLNSPRLKYGLTENFLCAGTPDGSKDSCQGDSGGPLIYKVNHPDSDENFEGTFYQVGIVSFGYQCAVKDYPGVYTKVSSYHPWIASYL